MTKIQPSQNDTLTATIKSKKGSSKEAFNKVLVSVGRKPNTGLLNTEATDVKVNDSGFIQVDVYQRTSVKNIFAIGDIVGNLSLIHI